MSSFDLTNPLDFGKVTSFFLYGTETPPPNLVDRIRPVSSESVTLNIDAKSFMANGPGVFF